MAKDEKKLLFEVNGVEIYEGSIYVVEDKEDVSAPSGFQETGATKLPSDGVADSFACNYVRTSGTTGVWDTGLYEFSPCYRKVNKKVVSEKLRLLQENVVEPYERMTQPGILDSKNDSFWERKRFTIYTNKVFDTEDPEDVLILFMALHTKELTPKGQEGDSKYNDSSYVVVDKTKKVKKEHQKNSILFEAIGIFEELVRSDKQKLIDILAYSDLTVQPDIDINAFRTIFKNYLESDRLGTNIDVFLRLYEDSNSDEGRQKFELYSKLKKAEKKGTRLTRNPNGVYYYNDEELGPDLKACAERLSKDKNLKPIKDELLFEDD